MKYVNRVKRRKHLPRGSFWSARPVSFFVHPVRMCSIKSPMPGWPPSALPWYVFNERAKKVGFDSAGSNLRIDFFWDAKNFFQSLLNRVRSIHSSLMNIIIDYNNNISIIFILSIKTITCIVTTKENIQLFKNSLKL